MSGYPGGRSAGSGSPSADPSIGKVIAYGVLSLVLFVALSVGGVAGCKSFNRYQKRAEANNNVPSGTNGTPMITQTGKP